MTPRTWFRKESGSPLSLFIQPRAIQLIKGTPGIEWGNIRAMNMRLFLETRPHIRAPIVDLFFGCRTEERAQNGGAKLAKRHLQPTIVPDGGITLIDKPRERKSVHAGQRLEAVGSVGPNMRYIVEKVSTNQRGIPIGITQDKASAVQKDP